MDQNGAAQAVPRGDMVWLLHIERLLQRERAQRAAAEEAQRRLAFVAEASEVLAASLDYTTTLATMARLAVPYLADCCLVDVVEADGSFGQTAAHHDPDKEALVSDVRRRFPPDPQGSHALAQVLRSGESIVVPHVTQAWLRTYTRNAEHYAVMREIGLRSYMCVPLATGGRVLGALTFLSAAPGRHYGPADVALAEEIGHHAALAIDNARLYREAQEAVAVRDHFLMAASHDLRTPLTVINGHAALMHRRLESGRVPDAVWLRTHVDAMSDAANRMASTVEEITDAAQLQMGRTLTLQLSTVDFGALVRSAIGVVAEANVRWRTGPLLVDAPDGVLVEGDRARLERVVQNVVGNAVKYSPPDAPVHVEVRAQAAQATMTVCDHGVGIPAAELPHIFTPFFRASTSASIGGTGIGLAGAKAIVEQHGGHIEVQSAVGEGTTVVVTLPNTGVQPSDAGQIIPT